MISEQLAQQLDALRAQLHPETAGALLCAWWSQLPLPDGLNDTRSLTFLEWQTVMNTLRQASLVDEIVPTVSNLQQLTINFHHDGPLPVCLARYQVARPTQQFVAAVRSAVAAGSTLPDPLPPLRELLDIHDVFVTGIPLHEQWGLTIPVVRSRRLLWSFDQRFWCALPGTPLPDMVEFDSGDGLGLRTVSFGDKVLTAHPTGDTVTYTIIAHWGADKRIARGTVAIGGQPAPLPDETWQLVQPGAAAGHAYVFHPPHAEAGTERLAKPIVLAEGFPGGRACDFLYELANQHGLLERLLATGHSVVLLGYKAGFIHIPANASVVIACLERISQRTKDPVSVGGVSMGGQVTRYALAWLEWCGRPHACQLYFSIDTPHLGSATSVAVQWFVRTFAHIVPGAADMDALICTPANRELLFAFLASDGGVRPDPAHQALLEEFQAIGNFPKQPRCIAVSSGHGRGGRSLEPGALLFRWTDHPFAEVELRASGPDPNQPVGQGACYPPCPRMEPAFYPNSQAWEGVPGGQANYIEMSAILAQASACGSITVHAPLACIVPTVSALYLHQEPDLPIAAEPPADSPFQAWATAEENLRHCMLTPSTAEFLFRELTAISTSSESSS